MGILRLIRRNDLRRVREFSTQGRCDQDTIDLAFLVACEIGHTDIVRYLVQEAGANVMCTIAYKKNWKVIYQLLCAKTGLDLANENEHATTVAYLEEAMGPVGTLKVKLNRLPKRHNRARTIAEAFALAERIIQDDVADINCCNKGDQETQLHLACGLLTRREFSSEATRLLEALLRKGANVNAVNWQGLTPLAFVCCSFGYGDPLRVIVGRLLVYGADPNARDKNGNTPLSFACRNPRVGKDVVSQLVIAGANVNTRNETGVTPLHEICMNRCDSDGAELVRFLTDNGAIHLNSRWATTAVCRFTTQCPVAI